MEYYYGESFENDNIEKEMNKEYIDKIKTFIPNFKCLNNIFKKELTNNYLRYKNNFFLNEIYCINKLYLSDVAFNKIHRIEQTLSMILPKLNKKEKNSFFKKMLLESSTKYTELSLYSQFIENKNFESIEYEKINNQTNDFRLKIGKDIINLELTHLCEDTFFKEITRILKRTSKFILSKLPSNKLLYVYFDLSKLLSFLPKEDKYNYTILIPILIDEILKYFPFIFIDNNNSAESFRIDDFVYFEDILIKDLCFDSFYYKLINDKKFFLLKEKIIKLQTIKHQIINYNISEFKTSFITFFIYGNSKGKYVKIESEKATWMVSEKKLREIYSTNHLLRRIKEKFEKNQLKGLENPYLFINYIDKTIIGYNQEHLGADINHMVNENKRFYEIKEKIETMFKKRNEKNIHGIFLYEFDYTKSRFIQNPNLKIDLDLVKKIISK